MHFLNPNSKIEHKSWRNHRNQNIIKRPWVGVALEENRIWMIRSEKWNKGEGVQLNRREEVKVNTERKRGRRDK